MFERIPAELRQLPQWALANAAKEPVQINGQLASVTDPSTWTTFNAVVEAQLRGDQPFISFVFTDRDQYTGIDLDKTDDPEIKITQQKIFEAFPSYAEKSQSGKGLHIIIRGKVPRGRRRKGVEVYSQGRHFIMTGDVYSDAPITECQTQLDILYAELGHAPSATQNMGDMPAREDDEQVFLRASDAVNGEKFKDLWGGNWQNYYQSQSEADFALVDIIAFYSPSAEQVTRMFRTSMLGQRPKAWRIDYMDYMLKRAYDNQPAIIDSDDVADVIKMLREEAQESKDTVPLVTADGASATTGKAKALPVVSLSAVKPKRAKAPFSTPADPYALPPGLIGEVAQYIYSAAPRPVKEIALAGAIGFMAGVCGRSYNVNRTGLNLYTLLIAPTGTGKEAIASGIDGMMHSIELACNTVYEFRGPGAIASGPALIKSLASDPSCVSVIGEFGYKFQAMASPNAGNADLSLKAMLLDLYNKSGHTQVFHRSVYSQKENNTTAIQSPAFSLVCETVPSKFYDVIDTSVIADGLLPRFIIIDCQNAKRVELNAYAGHAPSEGLQTKLIELVGYSASLQIKTQIKQCVDVMMDTDATRMLKEVDQYSTVLINDNENDVARHMWNRAHINTMRLASLVAIGCNHLHPTMTAEHVIWARGIIFHTIDMILTKFSEGTIGNEDSNEGAQIADVERFLHKYIMSQDYKEFLSYRSNQMLFEKRIVPFAALSIWTASKKSFKKQNSKPLVHIVQSMERMGMLVEVNGKQKEVFKTTAKLYSIMDAAALLR